MAHELENMFYTGATPWHGLGLKVEGAVTVADALRLAGLDWTVATRQLVLAEDTAQCDSLDDCRDIPARAVVRSTDGRVLGVVGLDYEPAQNWEKLAILQPLVEAGVAKLETAGSLRGGRRVWIQADLGNRGEVVKGDEVMQRILVCGSHDGSMAVRVQETETRVVCNNTLEMALGAGGKGVSIKHTRSVHDRMSEVSRVTAQAQANFAAALESYRFLASKRVSKAETRAYAKAVFAQPKPKQANAAPKGTGIDAASIMPHLFGGEGRPSGLTADDLGISEGAGDRVADRVMELADGGRGANIPGVAGTAWGAYNAVTEYLTHERGANPDTRLDSLWFGNGRTLNQRALDYALEMAK